MEPILIPSVPNEAFNKHRRISDLVRKQVDHFKHIEAKLPSDVRATLPQHEIVTEDDAARYIGPITNYLLSRPRPKSVAKKVVAIKPNAPIRSQPVALAAAAGPAPMKSAPKKKSLEMKESAPKKETPKGSKSPSINFKVKNQFRKEDK
jgi:hypothetical protein